MSWKLECTLFYQMGIQIYDQIWILGIWWKGKLRHAISLRFGLKEGKRALNITKSSMHSYLPNGHLNLRSNWSAWKLECTLVYQMGIKIYDQISISRKLSKVKLSSAVLNRVGIKGGQNSSKHRKIWPACLSIQYASKPIIKFQFLEFGQS